MPVPERIDPAGPSDYRQGKREYRRVLTAGKPGASDQIATATLGAARLRSGVEPDPVSPSIETLGARLHRLRTAAKLTQADVARHLGVSVASVCGWEHDTVRPRAGRIEGLAKLFAVPCNAMLGLVPIDPLDESAARLRSAVRSGIEPEPVSPSSESLGARLLRLRMAAELTQADVARHLGVSAASICAWENDKARPRAGRIEGLAKLLAVSCSAMLGWAPIDSLDEIVARAKSDIAAAANTSPEHVRITIEL